MGLFLAILGLCWLLVLLWLYRRQAHLPHTDTDAPVRDYRALYYDVLAGGLLFVGVLAFFWRTLSGDVFQPADGGDLVSFLYPTYRFAAEQLAQGSLPLWNPHLYGGAPFISDIQAGFLYPPLLTLFLVWPDFPYTALQWLSALHIYWAGLGMYILLRVLQWSTPALVSQEQSTQDNNAPGPLLSRPAALLGAVAFQFSDPLLTHFGNLNLIAVLSWLPWILAAFSRACATLWHDARWQDALWHDAPSRDAPKPRTWLHMHQLRWAAIAGVLFALANYAGHAQSSFYLGLTLALFALLSGLLGVGQLSIWRRLSNNLITLAMTGLLALLLTAPILLPTLEMSGYTERSDFTYQDSIAFSLAPTQAIGLVTPGFLGRGPALHWSLWDRVETPYAGVATLLLAIGALTLAARHHRRQLLIWLGIGVFGFLTALGVYALLHGWLAWAIPPFGQLRAPARALILWTLAISVLAAYGLDAVIRTLRHAPTSGASYLHLLRGGAWTWAGVILPLSFLSLLITLHDENAFLRASVAALALCFAGAWWIVTWTLIAAYRAGWFAPLLCSALLVSVVYMDLAAAGAYTDISSEDPTRGYHHPEIVEFLRNDPDVFRIDTRTDIEHLWQPDTAALHGLQDVDGIANPLMLRHWRDFWESTGGRHTSQYDLLNVKYVLVEGDTPLPEGKFQRVLEANGVTVHENLNFHPRAWIVHAAEVVPDQATARERFAAGEPNLASHVLLTQDQVERTAAETLGAGDAEAAASQASIVHYGSREIEIAVSAAAPGYLVLSEVWYPGWHATVDGQNAPVLRANYAQRAIAIPAGESTVHLQFWPSLWTWGLVLGGVGILAVVGALTGSRFANRPKRSTSAAQQEPAQKQAH